MILSRRVKIFQVFIFILYDLIYIYLIQKYLKIYNLIYLNLKNMTYNGIGLATARGSGTSGYV